MARRVDSIKGWASEYLSKLTNTRFRKEERNIETGVAVGPSDRKQIDKRRKSGDASWSRRYVKKRGGSAIT